VDNVLDCIASGAARYKIYVLVHLEGSALRVGNECVMVDYMLFCGGSANLE